MSKKHLYVTVYVTTREYGGPEEGGWWFDWTEVDGSVLVGRDKRHKLAKVIKQAKEYAKECTRKYAYYEVVIEHTLGSKASKKRPYYC